MPDIRPFRGIRYNPGIGNQASLIAPPYDIISKNMQEELYRSNPHNIVRLILGKIRKSDNAKDNRYIRAKRYFDDWLNRDVLVRDERDCIYVYSQKYNYNGRTIERIGFISLMGLDMAGSAKILPHENTLAAPKADRLSLMRAVQANLSPIFVLYEDSRHEIVKMMRSYCRHTKPLVRVKFEGAQNSLWSIDDPAVVKRLISLMKNKDVFIADGHHRFEVARMYSEEMQTKNVPDGLKENSKLMMVYFVESNEDMLTVLPAHRVIISVGGLKKEEVEKRLSEYFHIEKAAGLNKMMKSLDRSGSSHAFGLYMGKGLFYLLRLKNVAESDRAIKGKSKDWKRLDVSILHLFILQYVLGVSDADENIEFVKDAGEAVRLVDKGTGKMAFMLNPTKVWQVKRVARIGERMPRKATYFYPKPLSGLVINKF